MPVYHFIYHAYRSWNADHTRGYHQHGEKGNKAPQPWLAEYRDEIAKQPPMLFDDDQQWRMLNFAVEICRNRRWRIHAVGMDDTHVHIVVSWKTGEESSAVKDKIKNVTSLLLNQAEEKVGRRVFSRGAGSTPVRDEEHLAFLVEEYLPGQGGLYWRP